jgi:trans-aconitate methyltransferase
VIEPQTADWDPKRYSEQGRFVSDLGGPVLELLAPRTGERILDLGCGDGVLTKCLADLGCEVVGVDSSPEMIAAARGLGLDARVADGRSLPFETEFDAVFSNAALHWMKDLDLVVEGVWRALRPGGRFVGECGAPENVGAIVAALEAELSARGIDPKLLNPWFFPEKQELRRLLEEHGFLVRVLEKFARPTPLPGDLVGWLETFARSFVAAVSQAERKEFLEAVSERCRPALCDEHGTWTADYVRLRFAALRP